MTSDRTRNEAWEALWDANRLSRYYLSLNQRYAFRDKVATVLLVVGGTGTLAPLFQLQWIPEWTQTVCGLMVASLAIWTAVVQYQNKAAISHSIAVECERLAEDCRTLFNKIDGYQVTDEVAQARTSELIQAMDQITSRSVYAGLTVDDKINELSGHAVNEELTSRYGC